MNGQHIWALIGLICAVAGLAFITAGVRAGRARGYQEHADPLGGRQAITAGQHHLPGFCTPAETE
jgi:uncharacterized membrane protein